MIGLVRPLIAQETAALDATAASGSEAATQDDVEANSPENVSSTPNEAAASGELKQRNWVFDGFATEEYRFRYATAPDVTLSVLDAEGGSKEDLRRGADHDLRLFLGGNARDKKDRFWVNASFGLFADLDGFVASGDTSSLSSIHENASSIASLYPDSPAALWVDMYSLFGEYHSDGVPALVRLGRQESEHGRNITFDGAAIDIRAVKPYLDFFAFGGRTVHFFETDSNLYEDWTASAGAVIRPLSALKFELSYRFAREDYTSDDAMLDGSGRDTSGNLVNHIYGLTGWYKFEELIYLKAYFRGIGASPSEAGGALNLNIEPLDLGFDLKADAQLMTFREINESDDPYYAVLGESLPHVRLNTDLWKAFPTRVGTYTFHTGWASRILTEGEPEAFNRDFGRAYFSAEAADIGIKGPFVSAVGEFYYTHEDSERFWSAGGSAGYDKRPIRVEAGTYYQWVKYKYYADVEEIEDVRTYFLEARVRPLKWFTVRLKYELEQFDRLVHTAMLTLSQAN